MKIKYFMQIYYSLESFPFTKSWRFSMIAILIAISLVYDFSNTPFLLLGFPILSFRYSKVSIHFIKYTSLFDWSKYNRSKKWLHSIKSPHFVRLESGLALKSCCKTLFKIPCPELWLIVWDLDLNEAKDGSWRFFTHERGWCRDLNYR